MSTKKDPKFEKPLRFTLNLWLYDKLKFFAKENGLTVRGAIRFIINQFFKNKPEY